MKAIIHKTIHVIAKGEALWRSPSLADLRQL